MVPVIFSHIVPCCGKRSITCLTTLIISYALGMGSASYTLSLYHTHHTNTTFDQPVSTAAICGTDFVADSGTHYLVG